ncbi:hypothetical protein ElyMa_004051800 [Elysia marginata]|uniref:Uncharacterized protein n=1 Tax=Elysia marginata TaxID=1093978 RepID=A0AAV4G5G3_9GAST|nr:hypothetical protein ElyMa_004051800 [Elysia marginata]
MQHLLRFRVAVESVLTEASSADCVWALSSSRAVLIVYLRFLDRFVWACLLSSWGSTNFFAVAKLKSTLSSSPDSLSFGLSLRQMTSDAIRGEFNMSSA